MTTTLATAASILTWTILSWFRSAPSTGVGKATAAVVGLVAITPAAGYVDPMGAILIGVSGAAACFFFILYRASIIKRVDDTLDVFICHGIGGIVGSILTGVFATTAVNSAGANGLLYGNPGQVVKQLIAVAAVVAMSMIGTGIILLILKTVMNIRPTAEEENIGIDAVEHGEAAYHESENK